MSLNINNKNIEDLCIGNKQIVEACIGNNIIFSKKTLPIAILLDWVYQNKLDLLISNDLIVFNRQIFKTSFTTTRFKGIKFINNKYFLLYGDNMIAETPDGKTEIQHNIITPFALGSFYDIFYTGNKYLLATQSGAVIENDNLEDSDNWTDYFTLYECFKFLKIQSTPFMLCYDRTDTQRKNYLVQRARPEVVIEIPYDETIEMHNGYCIVGAIKDTTSLYLSTIFVGVFDYNLGIKFYKLIEEFDITTFTFTWSLVLITNTTTASRANINMNIFCFTMYDGEINYYKGHFIIISNEGLLYKINSMETNDIEEITIQGSGQIDYCFYNDILYIVRNPYGSGNTNLFKVIDFDNIISIDLGFRVTTLNFNAKFFATKYNYEPLLPQ